MAERSIAELVGIQLAQTEADIHTDSESIKWMQAKEAAIERAKIDLYYGMTMPEEAAMAMLVKFYLADCAAVYLIETATDWYKSQARLSDSKDGASIQWYDKVDALERQTLKLYARIAKTRDRIGAIVAGASAGDFANVPLTQVADEGRGHVTVDPNIMARFLYGDYVVYDEAVPFGLTPARDGA